MGQVLFLSISSVFYAISLGSQENSVFGALIFANHTSRCLSSPDADLDMTARMHRIDLSDAMDIIGQAHREHRVGWADSREGEVVRRTWRQLNNFLRGHGLTPVSEDGSYTTVEARNRITQKNPELRVVV
jgi:hypothetical protein